ncbi:MAG: IS1 family transposase [Stenomitos rutilans HA7619-LM2]|jgi:insertion element IS1 protein InsB|nr:IS1 family transposase [Stenomitos rutilans HA7619-LM2]
MCPVTPELLVQASQAESVDVLVQRVDEAEMDEMCGFVSNKRQQRWLWHAIDHATGSVVAYVLLLHTDAALESLMQWLTPFGIKRFYING